MEKVRWGILSTADIGAVKVIPAMQKGRHCDILGIASRSPDKAKKLAAKLNIPQTFGSYEDLLACAEIDAVYIPLPNHLHVPWSIKALEAGKHVLCEKPIALSAAEAQTLLDAGKKHPSQKIMEAFMYRHHPQWQKARELAAAGEIGELKTIQSFFSYYNDDPADIRNNADIGGGGLMDIGCYTISFGRFIFGAEPQRVCGMMEYDPKLDVDCIACGTGVENIWMNSITEDGDYTIYVDAFSGSETDVTVTVFIGKSIVGEVNCGAMTAGSSTDSCFVGTVTWLGGDSGTGSFTASGTKASDF